MNWCCVKKDIILESGDVDDEAFGYLKRVIVTPTVYPHLLEFLHSDIRRNGQKSHCISTQSWRYKQCSF